MGEREISLRCGHGVAVHYFPAAISRFHLRAGSAFIGEIVNSLISSPCLVSRVFILLATLSLIFPSFSHAGTFVAFGPQNYTRGTGKPVPITSTFTVLNPNTGYTIRINNGGLTGSEFKKVSSAVITLNGIRIIGPKAFEAEEEGDFFAWRFSPFYPIEQNQGGAAADERTRRHGRRGGEELHR